MRPLCSVDHVRVLDDRSGIDDEEMLYVDVLDWILETLDREGLPTTSSTSASVRGSR